MKELGFDAMTENASTSVVAPKGTTGTAEPLAGAIDPNGETMTTEMEMPQGGTVGL